MINNTAQIDASAKIADDVTIGPWTVIGPDVQIGAGTVIGSHVVIKGSTRIGVNNHIYQFASVGEDCQDKKYHGEKTHLVIGDNNVIREGCTLHRGTVQDQGVTRIGDNNLFMVNVHIAHDAMVGNGTVMANNVTIAGHVHIGDYAVLGGFCGVHQFCKVGTHSMCGGGSIVLQDVSAYTTISGNPATSHGINKEGLRRRGFEKEVVSALRSAYKIMFRRGLAVKQAVEEIRQLPYQCPELEIFIESILVSSRGIVR